MRTTTMHTWTHEDASLAFVDEALNLMANFQRPAEDQDGPALKAAARCTALNQPFHEVDVRVTIHLLRDLALRCRAKAAGHPQEVRDSLHASAKRVEEAGERLRTMFLEAKAAADHSLRFTRV